VQRKIVVSCNVAGRDIGSTVSDIQDRMRKNVPLGQGAYEGYYAQLGGQFESAESSFRLLLILGCGVVLAIGLLLHIAFQSARDAMLVLFNLPMALIGGVFGVMVSGGVLSIASLVGFITLLGIATRNGIMLVSHIRHLQREEGEADFRSAVRRGAMERLAPILMTALSTGLGLLPLALAGGKPGSEIETPLAIVVLFGLLSSTFLNMAVMPALFLKWADPKAPEGMACDNLAPGQESPV
jgi:Cu/Ag efflux pump CusA